MLIRTEAFDESLEAYFFERLMRAFAQPAFEQLITCRLVTRQGGGWSDILEGQSWDGFDDEEGENPLAGSEEFQRLPSPPLRELPFWRFLDFSSTKKLGAEIAVFQPDVILAWDALSLKMLPKDLPMPVVGVLTDYLDLTLYQECGRMVALTMDLLAFATEEGWPPALIERAPVFVLNQATLPSPRLLYDTDDSDFLLVSQPLKSRDKALDFIFEALDALPEAVLWVPMIGTPSRSLLKLLSEDELGERVRLIEEEDHTRLFAAADAIVLARETDALGLGVIEAWSLGKPVVAVGAPGPGSLIKQAVTGLLTPPGEPEEMTKAVERLLRDPLFAERMGAEGRKLYEQNHSEARSLEYWLALLHKLAGVYPGAPDRKNPEGKRTDITV
ncbi:glycosyltransferase family 4 protein [Rhodovibrionaceae bacterium A322]